MTKKIILWLIILIILVFIPTIVNANSDIIVMLDPGHGGKYDSGAVYGNLRETDITWKITTEVKKILDNTAGITGILTREQNTNPEIYQRGDMAKQYGADLVVSFHINSSTSSLPRGSEVYVTRNNRVDRFYKNSNTLAVNVLNNLANMGIPRNGSFVAKLRPTESGNLYPDGTYADYYGIIRYPMNYGIPSVLIEHCFITNQYDRAFINNDQMIKKIAQADAQAIINNKELFRIDKTRNSVKGALDKIYYDSNSGSIKGKVLYNEVINDMSLDTQPIVSLVSTDGKVKVEGSVLKESSYTYQYEINIMNLDPYKRYELQVETKEKASIPNNNELILPIPDGKLGTIYGMEIEAKKGSIEFNAPYYEGYINAYPFSDISITNNKISGKLIVQEWLNDKQIEPRDMPKVVLTAEDGSKIECNVNYIEPYIYEYSCDGNKIDKTKRYDIIVESGTDKNISSYNKMKVKYVDKIIGLLDIYTVSVKDNKLNFIYDGYMTNSQYTPVELSNNKISGKLIVQEWLNGTVQVEPTSVPKLVIKNEKGSKEKEINLTYVEPYVYSYNINIGELDKNTQYTFEVQGTNPNNTSTHQNVEVNLNDQELGKIDDLVVKIEKGKLIIEEENANYDGYMTNSPYTPISLNGTNINGKLVVQEWLDGTKQIEPTTLPKLVIKNQEGKEVKETILKYVEPYVYSYNIEIGDLNKNEKYTFEVQGTNPNNISTHKNVEVNFNNQEIGIIGNDVVKIENAKLVIEEKNNNYDGYMTNSPYTPISLNGTKISGKLIVQEWLNGTVQIEPTTLPQIVIKGANGEVIKSTTLSYVEPYVYSYNIEIGDLNKNEKYTFEVQGTNPDNISKHQNVKVEFSNQNLGKIDNYQVEIENGNLNFKKTLLREKVEETAAANKVEKIIEEN